ncbi:diguanylate cyclase domain-containing protein [Aeromonas hydrophila]|uniref:PAS:GGDEF domain protein n=1 Tax=Aeromonas hydrophila subsp. hydrophila (strain ATCC 7966 / DSM 30187 / BCRC 13018 / CCUG 14551 / JCM 1027 / KCTC 2358 / NCIMB 9240 / NCTC 8049) TaxID=380703 RepID=A0KMH1_AERHH|nr:diguanylate cyclase [Aeromonas hydrophila]ABK36769.1 PAS:GGDEF domain protein [Aeromonas hydrophila subsp. hydrophila ATCC 7966]MBS4672111.1 diguanylate cyclase [Aeromonas hydrophila]OOD36261.1 diguanylate cyclase [Aeromonas hydrophila]SUU30333.1 PAS/GGDEF domain-containing protein [Aeromonas hydrophila]
MSVVNSSLHRLLRYLPMLGSAMFCTLFSLPSKAVDKIVVQLPWQHQFQFAGYYAAQARGFYRDAGLDVTLRPAVTGTNVVNEVMSGNAQYGVSGSDLLLARANGQQVVVLASMLQHSPLVLLTLERPDIRQPADLAGKRLMLEPGSQELQIYLNRHAPPGSWSKLPYEQGLKALLAGQVDAISAYSTTEPFYLARMGIPYRVFSPRSIDFDFYGDNLFTSERELNNRPERVYAFQQASLKGWRYAMENPAEMINWIMEQYPSGYGREQLEFEASATRELMQPDLVEPGYMQPERWQQIARSYLEAGLLSALPDLEHFLYNPDRERIRQQRQLLDKSVAVAMLVTFSLLTLLGIFCYLYLRLRQEARYRQRLTRELAQSEQHYRFVAENSADVIWTMDTATLRFRYVSPAILPLSGYEAIDVLTLPIRQLIPETSRKQLRAELSGSLAAWQRGDHEQTRCVIRTQLRHKEGHLVATETITTLHGNEQGEPEAILGVTRDITERAAREEMMRRLAFYDPLTNLPNRRLLQQRLKEAMESEAQLALLFIDLDHFKPINDTFGHETGDVLLNMVAERMRHCVRERDLVARLGGDEFVILLPDTGDEALAVADHLHQSLRHPFRIDEEQELRISSSIGVALYPEHGTDPKTLMHHADQAMYQAKGRGRGRVCLFTAGLDPEQGSLVWQSSHECGHPRIDAEHRQLFVLTNRLLEHMKDHQEHPALFLECMESLFDVARHHFAFEEQMLAELGYPELAGHQQDHQLLLQKASQLMTAARAGTLGNDELLNFIIQELVVGHMSQADRRYFPLMKGR